MWGGTLVPFDTIWRTGANEATHLATSKTIVLGDMTLAPGLYTLWTQHTRGGTFLIVNKQVGQWGTEYPASQDIGRVKMDLAKTPEHVEDFTITVRATGPNRGAMDFAVRSQLEDGFRAGLLLDEVLGAGPGQAGAERPDRRAGREDRARRSSPGSWSAVSACRTGACRSR